MRVHKKVIAYHLALPPVEPVDISIVGGNSNSRYSTTIVHTIHHAHPTTFYNVQVSELSVC